MRYPWNPPVIQGVIERRILANFRVDPQTLASFLPPPFRPQLVQGYGIAGICLIRLAQVRPRGWPGWIGLKSENAAHRAAVEWEEEGTLRQGVYVKRRDTVSRLNSLSGGRLFPGVHHHARFQVEESAEQLSVAMASDDGQAALSICGRVTDRWPATSIFSSVDEASAFFAAGSLGYSDVADGSRFQGMELQCEAWEVEPLEVAEVRSSLFDDSALFPPGSVEFDNALLMRGIEHQWHARPDLCCTSAATGDLAASR